MNKKPTRATRLVRKRKEGGLLQNFRKVPVTKFRNSPWSENAPQTHRASLNVILTTL